MHRHPTHPDPRPDRAGPFPPPSEHPYRRKSTETYGLRFAFGGAITAITGLIAHNFGPVVGGLFLAFPAILPASVTLIEDHEGDRAAGASSLGAAIGSLGLLAFGAVVWGLARLLPGWLTLGCALIAWFVVAAGLWAAFEWLRHRRREAERSSGCLLAGRRRVA